MSNWNLSHVEIVAKMARAKVTGKHHTQRDTIKRWANLDGDVFEAAMDDLITAPDGPVHQKGRGTVQLTSIHESKQFIEENDPDDEYIWFL